MVIVPALCVGVLLSTIWWNRREARKMDQLMKSWEPGEDEEHA